MLLGRSQGEKFRTDKLGNGITRGMVCPGKRVYSLFSEMKGIQKTCCLDSYYSKIE